ncbi:Aste57867_7990 [Aphanomyces stellatus]|nr:hypothetical protein As57867_007957 [Aphanomyces stellatus]KAF0701580.1 hypothetical protein As57867_007960 [Aphanomyces stellatus]VFT84880.1 Aste57867_7987 [Aphanomyces stellatus]VFT84883.1 Aste57867_7990 [Aphanomyces stellatus]
MCLRPNDPQSICLAIEWVTHKHALAAYNIVELGCQSVEAIAFATKVVDHNLVAIYESLVALHAMVAPWIIRVHHSTPRLLLLNWFLTLISFNVSYIAPLVALVVPLMHYFLVDFTEARPALDHPNRPLRPILIQFGMLASIWRMLVAVDMTNTLYFHGRRLSAAAFVRTSDHGNLILKLYMVCSTLWGLVLLVSLAHALVVANHCMYVHVNCHAIGHEVVDGSLQGSVLGSGVFALVVSRCDLPLGIYNGTLNQFQSLVYVGIKFTNMTPWTGQLPPTTAYEFVEYARLTRVPDILQANLQSSLTTLWLNNLPMTTFAIPNAWHNLLRLSLSNLSLAYLPQNITAFPLNDLYVQHNALESLPAELAHMCTLDLADGS